MELLQLRLARHKCHIAENPVGVQCLVRDEYIGGEEAPDNHYLQLASLEPLGKDNLLRFAENFGWPEIPDNFCLVPVDQTKEFRQSYHEYPGYDVAIPISDLQKEIRSFKKAVKKHRTDKIPSVRSVVDWLNLMNRKLNQFGRSDFGPAITNEVIKVLNDSPAGWRGPVDYSIRICSFSSIGAAWLQLIAASVSNQQLGVCSAIDCQNLFEVKPTRKNRRKFCGNACRLREYRKKNR